MNLLLDTHILLWYFEANEKLSEKAKIAIEDSKNKKFISIATIWELAIKQSLNKINFENGFENFLKLIEESDFEILPLKIETMLVLSTLELIHRDPFDRILVAQCISENMVIISKHEHILKYPIKAVW
jgi:PIN domain nuclease of toxin-antitoxin system